MNIVGGNNKSKAGKPAAICNNSVTFIVRADETSRGPEGPRGALPRGCMQQYQEGEGYFSLLITSAFIGSTTPGPRRSAATLFSTLRDFIIV